MTRVRSVRGVWAGLVATAFWGVCALPVATNAEETAGEPALARSVHDASLAWGPCPALFPAGCEIAVLHGDPAKPNADVFLRVPGGYALPLHAHTSAERMTLVAGALQVTYQGQPTSALKPGMYAYGPPGRPHDGRCASAEACVLFIAFEGPVDAIAVAK